MANSGLESFVNTIRNMYQNTNANYNEIFNTINTHLDFFNENSQNLIDNILPIFTLPLYTLPHMTVIYVISSQPQQLNNINQERFLVHIENCIQQADIKQVINFV